MNNIYFPSCSIYSASFPVQHGKLQSDAQKAEGSMMKVLFSHLNIYVTKEEWISRIQPHENADLHFIPPFCFIFRFLNTLPLGTYF